MCQQCFSDLTVCRSFIAKYQKSQNTLLALNKRCITTANESQEQEKEIQTKWNSLKSRRKLCEEYKEDNVDEKLAKTETDLDLEIKEEILEDLTEADVLKLDVAYATEPNETQNPPKTRNREKIYKFYCSFCPKSFYVHSHFMSHLQSHSDRLSRSNLNPSTKQASIDYQTYIEKYCNVEYAKLEQKPIGIPSSYKTSPELLPKKPNFFCCPYCPRFFLVKFHLISHVQTHVMQQPISCLCCPATFLSKEYLWQHSKVHGKKLSHGCAYCNEGFVHVKQLTKHLKMVPWPPPFTCGICGEMFELMCLLQNHTRVHPVKLSWENSKLQCHADFESFPCNECGARFTVKSNLEMHRKYRLCEKMLKSKPSEAMPAVVFSLHDHNYHLPWSKM